jgi:hypothetical protein
MESRGTPTASFGGTMEVEDGNSRTVQRPQLIQMGKCGREGRRRRYKNFAVVFVILSKFYNVVRRRN